MPGFFRLLVAVPGLAAALTGCATDGLKTPDLTQQVLGKPKTYFYDLLGAPAAQGTDAEGLEWIRWEGVAKYEQNFSYEPHVWKLVVRFEKGLSVAYTKPPGFHPPPAFMRRDAHGVQGFGSQRFP